MRGEQNNNHELVDNHLDQSVSSATSTEDIANMDTELVHPKIFPTVLVCDEVSLQNCSKSNLTRRRSLADSVHDLQHELEKELELRLGPDIDIGELPHKSTGVKTFIN